jgi:sporulation protein YlmC with PRC-barrel domain
MNRSLTASVAFAVLFGVASLANAADPAAPGVEIKAPFIDVKIGKGQAESSQNLPPWRASATIGMAVKNRGGESVGKIEDLVFEPSSGRMRYAVLSFGGFLGLGDKYFAVPWDHFQAYAKEENGELRYEHFILDVDPARLKEAPGFDKNRWPNFGDPQVGSEVDKFYGRPTQVLKPAVPN